MTIGTAARLLLKRGHIDAVLLLSEVKSTNFQWTDSYGDGSSYHHVHEVDFSLLDDLTEEVADQIQRAFNDVMTMDEEHCSGVSLVPSKVAGDWRADVQAALNGTPVNQATLRSLPDRWWTEDDMKFRDGAEVKVYQGLKRAQAKLPATKTITIAPNPSARIPGHTFEPDFLIAYLGRCGIIEVDGYSHQKRWAADKTKDQLYEDAGVAYISRINVEDTKDPASVDTFIERFLNRLKG